MSNTIMSNNMKLINIMCKDVQTTINNLHSKWKNILKSQDITIGEITAQLLVMAPRMLQILSDKDTDNNTEKIYLSLCSEILTDVGNDLKDEEEDSSFRSKDFVKLFEEAMLKNIIKDEDNKENKEDK